MLERCRSGRKSTGPLRDDGEFERRSAYARYAAMSLSTASTVAMFGADLALDQGDTAFLPHPGRAAWPEKRALAAARKSRRRLSSRSIIRYASKDPRCHRRDGRNSGRLKSDLSPDRFPGRARSLYADGKREPHSPPRLDREHRNTLRNERRSHGLSTSQLTPGGSASWRARLRPDRSEKSAWTRDELGEDRGHTRRCCFASLNEAAGVTPRRTACSAGGQLRTESAAGQSYRRRRNSSTTFANGRHAGGHAPGVD